VIDERAAGSVRPTDAERQSAASHQTHVDDDAVKRRCAGCNRVITGRPNKLYCSDQCRDAAKKRRRRNGDKVSPDTGPVRSVIRGTNGVLIAAVARLGYLDGGPVLDLTYGRGGWWTRYRPPDLIAFDGDFRNTGLPDGSAQVVCYDPPYISTGSKATSSIPDFYDLYGIGEAKGAAAVRCLMEAGLAECARILDGRLLMKCMDYVESGEMVWNVRHFANCGEALGLRLIDQVIHVTGGGPQPHTNLDGSPREQQHARQVHSTLLIFAKGTRAEGSGRRGSARG
jgi:hypothetical protein